LQECFLLSLQSYKKYSMIIVPIKENESIDKALKKFKKKFEKTGVVRALRSRSAFEKPSITRRTTVKKAIYRDALRAAESTNL
jgi:small subunit ribosomal protein S21